MKFATSVGWIGLTALVAMAALAGGMTPPEAPAPSTNPAMPASDAFAKLKFLHGCWQLKDGDSQLDEYWSAPAGNCMMGVFRWVKGGKATMYELLTITADDQGVIYRMRHFNGPALVPWAMEADGPLTYPLANLSDTEAIFEDPARAHPKRFIFRKQGDNGLLVRFEGEQAGKPAGQEFLYTRKACME